MVFSFSSFLHHGGIEDLNRLPTRPWPSSPVVVDGRSPLFVIKRVGLASPFGAELWGIHHGLRIAHDMGINHLDLECDSALAVKTITGVNVGDMQNHLTVWSIKELLRLNCDVGISQIPISLNTCADRLAKSSLNCEGGLLILNSPPKVDSKEHENMDDNGNIDDNIDGTNEYDITEPPHEQLYTDSDRENDVNKYGIELGYWNGGEESERSVGIDEGDSSASGSDVEKSEILNTIKNVKGKKFEYDDYGKIHLECSLFFVDVNEFRNVLRDYVIQENFDIIRVKNEKARVTAICASDGCPWRIHASSGLDGRAFMIKSYEPSHTCIRQSEKNNITSTWIVEKLKGSLSADPNMSYELMSNELNTKFGVEAHRMQLYRARKKGKEQVEGSHVESYKKMLKYAELLLERNRGSIVKLNYHDRTSLEETPVFKRIFVCLAACRDGFLNGCRPFFGLDGCHLKGPYGGVLLCAVSLDANNGLFPIAFAVVEVESKDSWSYFLEHLLEAIGDDRYIIMSDRQKGLTQAVSEIFSNSWHRHCMDGLRVKIMMRIYAKSITSWPQSVGPRIVKAINETIEDARFCRVKLAGRNLYEVYDGFSRFPVDLISHTCECKAWQISGLPCKHGAAAIIYTRAKVENFCDAYYSIEKYITTYSGLVSPLPGLNTLEEIDLLPPPLRRLPGRPKKSRRREKDEAPPSDVRRKLSTIKCTNCGQLGHNKRSCQRAPIKAKEKKTRSIYKCITNFN
ncbi:uncharacterized protein G2W53_021240 [Senna tora]|uniref:SWIM-type domain-containing protein n=1 Tax=Senna tora TaxID=362788 RepID=A0A834TL78_9FABA|nr:uncharacterized protein G2W53_021240 [Senna tora]